jgi:hypothetical protein
MRPLRRYWVMPVAPMLVVAACGGGDADSRADAAGNPCAAEATNPCAANPCAANPCAASGMIDAAAITQGDRALDSHGLSNSELVARGAELWNDKSLSKAGTTACSSCHAGYAMMNASFSEPYPHAVKMAKERAGLDEVTAAEMVQLCMVIPMAAEPLAWESAELAALSAHVEELQRGFTGPTGAMNPCAANPCAANPCATGAANPCAANPCGG